MRCARLGDGHIGGAPRPEGATWKDFWGRLMRLRLEHEKGSLVNREAGCACGGGKTRSAGTKQHRGKNMGLDRWQDHITLASLVTCAVEAVF